MRASSPTRTSDAWRTSRPVSYTHLLYAADVQQGPVGLDAVRDGLEASLLATKQDETYAAQVETWTQEAKVTTNRNALDN